MRRVSQALRGRGGQDAAPGGWGGGCGEGRTLGFHVKIRSHLMRIA